MPIGGTESTLSALIQSEMTNNGVTITDSAETDKLTLSIAKAVIDHIVANATVNVTSVSGVTTGPGVSGPGTGTIS